MRALRVIALLATHNEEHFIAGCLEHLFGQGVDVYLIDDSSTDQTVSIAERYSRKGLVGIERSQPSEYFDWRALLARKEQLAMTLDADWFMHVDADEIHVTRRPGSRLASAFTEADANGFNVVNFQEVTFIPTREAPDHDNVNFKDSMRWYYPFRLRFPYYMRAWKRQAVPVKLAHQGGHVLDFPGLRMCPEPFTLRHYICLGYGHAIRKYTARRFNPTELADGWHGWRARVRPETIRFPSETEIRTYVSDDRLDFTSPRTTHYLDDVGTVADRVRTLQMRLPSWLRSIVTRVSAAAGIQSVSLRL